MVWKTTTPRPTRFRPSAEMLETRLALSTYFVAPNGSDTYTGSDAGSISHPFATIQKAANLAVAGDTVYLRAGTYHEDVIPTHSGTAAAPITFMPYNGESVTIDGADPITGWSAPSGSTYQAPMSWDLGRGNNQVFVDGQMVQEARWPNQVFDGSATPAYATVASGTRTVGSTVTVTINDSALTQPAGFWNGATFDGSLGKDWVFESGTVISSAPGTLTVRLDTSPTDGYQPAPVAGNHFFLSGTAAALDSAGEWYRGSDGILRLWTPASDNPANHLVEVKHRQYGFDLSGKSYIDVEGIHFFACSINTSAATSHIVLDGINALYVSHFTVINGSGWSITNTGIILNGTDNTLRNSVIAYSAGNGVLVEGTGNAVVNCVIHDVDYAGVDDSAVTLGNYGDLAVNALVSGNTLSYSGRTLVQSRNARGSQIVHNDMSFAMLRTSDGGATYTYGQDGQGTVIAYNTIHDITASYGAGIYLDNGTSDYVVHHNIIWNVPTAIHVNMPSYNNKVYNNTALGTSQSLDVGFQSSSFTYDYTGTEFKNNIFTNTVYTYYGSATGSKLPIFQNNLLPGTDPKFANPSQHNYQLLTGSPAINAGQVISPYTNGYVGSLPDIGAVEYGAAAWTAGSTLASTPLAPLADAYIRDGTYAGTNFGQATQLVVKNGGVGYDRVIYLTFDLSSLSTVNSAQLRLYGSISSTNNTNLALAAFAVSNATWKETGITWNNAPATGTSPLSTATVLDNTPRWYTFDLTSYVQQLRAAHSNRITIAIKMTTFSAGDYVLFNSRESGVNAPQLVIS